MAFRHSPKQLLLGRANQVVGNNKTAQVISDILHLSDEQCLHLTYFVSCSAATLDSSTVDVLVQHSFDQVTWTTIKTISISAASDNIGRFRIEDAVADQAFMPLYPFLRFAVTTGDGSGHVTTATFDSVQVH